MPLAAASPTGRPWSDERQRGKSGATPQKRRSIGRSPLMTLEWQDEGWMVVPIARYSALPVSKSLYTSAIAALCTITQYAKTYTKTAALHHILTPSANITAIATAPDEPATTNANHSEGGSLVLAEVDGLGVVSHQHDQ